MFLALLWIFISDFLWKILRECVIFTFAFVKFAFSYCFEIFNENMTRNNEHVLTALMILMTRSVVILLTTKFLGAHLRMFKVKMLMITFWTKIYHLFQQYIVYCLWLMWITLSHAEKWGWIQDGVQKAEPRLQETP
jgi:hypothetical protein